MCVAVVNPKGVKIPSREDLLNCFESNPDGAGYALHRNGKIHINKGYMDFDKFYEAFKNEDPQKDENVFLHFRIATHGLVDGGNTHPFPITDDFDLMRKTNQEIDGKCLIHNGIFHYSDANMVKHDKTKTISDTMLFSKLLYDKITKIQNKDIVINNLTSLGLELSVAKGLLEKTEDKKLLQSINSLLCFSKIAIMNEDGSFEKYGNWREYHNTYYSNNSYLGYDRWRKTKNFVPTTTVLPKYNPSLNNKEYFEDFTPPAKNYNIKKVSKHIYCEFCGKPSSKYQTLDNVSVCNKCIDNYDLVYCECCKMVSEKRYMANTTVCIDCFTAGDDINTEINHDYKTFEKETQICISCGQNYDLADESEEEEVCALCYKEIMSY